MDDELTLTDMVNLLRMALAEMMFVCQRNAGFGENEAESLALDNAFDVMEKTEE